MQAALDALRCFSTGGCKEGAALHAASEVKHVFAPKPSSVADVAQAESEVVPPEFDPFRPAEDEDDEGPTRVTELYTWGRAATCQLGFGIAGDVQPVPRLVNLPGGVEIRNIACSQFHTLAVVDTGAVYSWGFNGEDGRLGVPAVSGSSDPSFVVEPARLPDFGLGGHVATKVAAGSCHSLILTEAGKMFAWGSNSNGQLGLSGTQIGKNAAIVRRPTWLKSCKQTVNAVDIAAGTAHSLCAGSCGGVYSWGSNAGGALGLGAPPAGPVDVSTPHKLPHIMNACQVLASPNRHASAVLTVSGDVMFFGGASCAPNSKIDEHDAKAYLPSRVRRRIVTPACGVKADEEEGDWQKQRGPAAHGRNGPPFVSVVLGLSDMAFGIDSSGTLWEWQTTTERPCFATPTVILQSLPITSKSAASLNLKVKYAAAVAGRTPSLWVTDNTPESRPWRLSKTKQGWSAERSEHIAQAGHVACSNEHQAILVSFARPEAVSRRLEPPGPTETPGGCEDEEARMQPGPQLWRSNVPSLQQLCEEKLCETLNPRSLLFCCQVAWELNRPALLDRAFGFLQANVPLMFSRMYLPSLARLPSEVLAAFQLVSAGRFDLPSVALESVLSGEAHAEHGDLFSPMLEDPIETPTSTGQACPAERRPPRRANAVSAGAAERSTVPGASAWEVPGAAAGLRKVSGSPVVGPQPKEPPMSPGLGISEEPKGCSWTEITKGKRRSCPGVKGLRQSEPEVARSGSSPLCKFGTTDCDSPSLSKTSPSLQPALPPLTLLDFVVQPRRTRNSHKQCSPEEVDGKDTPTPFSWGLAEVDMEPSVNIRDLLAQHSRAGSRAGSGRAAEITSCWGLAALPSEKPPGESVYEIQQREEEENKKIKADEEVAEIEAMFAALEVAEREEENEFLGLAVTKEKSKVSPKSSEKKERSRKSRDRTCSDGQHTDCQKATDSIKNFRNRPGRPEQGRGSGWKHNWWQSGSSSKKSDSWNGSWAGWKSDWKEGRWREARAPQEGNGMVSHDSPSSGADGVLISPVGISSCTDGEVVPT